MTDLDFNNLLRIAKLIGGKYVIVEDGKPTAVLMGYQDFEDLALPSAAGRIAKQIADIEQINSQITKAQLTDLREEVIADLPFNEGITIEPLDLA